LVVEASGGETTNTLRATWFAVSVDVVTAHASVPPLSPTSTERTPSVSLLYSIILSP
jgi:hypothetical protein